MNGYPWSKLRDQAQIVDVGSGIGHVALTLAEALPQIRVVLQDLPNVIREAKTVSCRGQIFYVDSADLQLGLQFWKMSSPRDVESGRICLMEYDFFTEQPVRRADVYVLRAIV